MFSKIQTPRPCDPVARSLDHMILGPGSLKTHVFILSSKLLYFFYTFLYFFILYLDKINKSIKKHKTFEESIKAYIFKDPDSQIM